MLIKSFIIPYPIIKKKKSKQLITMNNYNKIHWSALNSIKNKFKDKLKSWYIDQHGKIEDKLIIEITPIRHNKRKLDAINAAFVAKWIEDALIDLRFINDDDRNSVVLRPSKYNEKTIETMLSVKIFDSNSIIKIIDI